MALAGQVAQKIPDLGSTQFPRVTPSMMQNEAPDPVDISLFGSIAVVPQTDRGPDCVQKSGWCGHGIAGGALTS